jgi:solute carrier family 25 phosphate transporter 3
MLFCALHHDLLPPAWPAHGAAPARASARYASCSLLRPQVVKTRIQTNPELYDGGIIKATRKIVDDEGPGFLLQGLAPTCVGYGVEGALKFGCYEAAKPLAGKVIHDKMLSYLLASVLAGGVASVVLCPAEDVRIRLVADPTYAAGPLEALRKIAAEKGSALASFEGVPAMCAKQVPYTMGKQVSFDFCCQAVRALTLTPTHRRHHRVATFLLWQVRALVLLACRGDEARAELVDWTVPLIAALPAAVMACVLSHPGDMVLTEYYKGSGRSVWETVHDLVRARRRGLAPLLASAQSHPSPSGHRRNSHAPESMSWQVREGGLAALFRGIHARLIHVISIIWVQLIIYDQTKRALGLPATGH